MNFVNSKMRLVRSLHKTVKTIKAIKTVKTVKTIKAIKIVKKVKTVKTVKTIKKESIYISVQHFQNTAVSNICVTVDQPKVSLKCYLNAHFKTKLFPR